MGLSTIDIIFSFSQTSFETIYAFARDDALKQSYKLAADVVNLDFIAYANSHKQSKDWIFPKYLDMLKQAHIFGLSMRAWIPINNVNLEQRVNFELFHSAAQECLCISVLGADCPSCVLENKTHASLAEQY